jgi:flavodoxin I
MKKIKLIFGTDTGNTEYVINTYLLSLLENEFEVKVVEVDEITSEDWESHNFFILGIPTWYDGLLQSDWEDYFEEFKQIDFTGKTLALFGLGDQIGYAEYFVDGIGILAEVILKNGGKIIGYWPKEGYEYLKSKAELNKEVLYGLALDEDNEDNLTQERCEKWILQLKKEINE